MPEARIITASHTQALALDLSSKARSVITSDLYQRCYPGIEFTKDSEGHQKNSKGGERLTCTVGGKTPIGFHGHIQICLPWESKIITDRGILPIGRIVDERLPIRVLGYSHLSEKLEYQDVEAYEKNLAGPLCRVEFSNGNVLELTEDHLVYVVGRGYVPASQLLAGDEVLRVLPFLVPGLDHSKVLVESVELGVRTPEATYNLRVAPHHNYFAEGILVHNCDDPIDPQKALSEVELRNASDFVTNVMPTRAVDKEVTVLVLIMQRVAYEDPTGTLLDVSRREHTGKVKHYCLPAELEDDNTYVSPPELRKHYVNGLMDPRRLPRHVLRRFEATMGRYAYQGQFLQKPIPPGGQLFREEYFSQRVKAAPYNSRRIRFWDRAATADAGCYTAGVLMAKDSDGNYFIEDVCRGQWEPGERNQKMRAVALRDRQKYGPKHEPTIYVEREGGSSGRDAWKGVAKALEGFVVIEYAPTGKKEVRAEPYSAQLAAKNVFVVDNGQSKGTGMAQWDIGAYVKELMLFPLGRYKDQTDASCLLGDTLVKTAHGLVPIINVVAGDFVLTRRGYKEVLWSGQSGATQVVVSVLFSNGSVVSGTRGHLVWTGEGNWVTLDSLSGEHTVLLSPQGGAGCPGSSGLRTTKGSTCASAAAAVKSSLRSPITSGESLASYRGTTGRSQTPKPLFSTVSGITEGLVSATFGARVPPSLSTELSGSSTTVTFPVAVRYTTRTATGTTTLLKILSVSRLLSTLRGIPVGELTQDSVNILRECESLLLSGMGQKKAGSGTASTARRLGLIGSRRSTLAPSAASPLCRDARDQSTAPPSAWTDVDTRGELIRDTRRLASGAARTSWDQRRPCSARIAAPEEPGTPSVAVYDLCVRDEHEFFANGVLVHNSGCYNILANTRPPAGLRTYNLGSTDKKKRKKRLLVCNKQEMLALPLQDRGLLVSLAPPVSNSVISDSGAIPTFKVRTENPAALDRTLAQLGGVLEQLDDSTYKQESGCYFVRAVTSTQDFLKFAIANQGYGKVVEEENSLDLLPADSNSKILYHLTLNFLDADPAQHQDSWHDPVSPYNKCVADLVMQREHGKRLWSFLLRKRDPVAEVWVFQDDGGGMALSVAFGVCDALKLKRSHTIWQYSRADYEGIDEEVPKSKYVYDMVRSTRSMVIA